MGFVYIAAISLITCSNMAAVTLLETEGQQLLCDRRNYILSDHAVFFCLYSFVSDALIYWQEKQESHQPNDNPWLSPFYRPRTADIEITAYALLAYSLNKEIAIGLAISRWLSQQRNSLGGYSSTQVFHLFVV